jgi:hypothetical protein
MSQVLLLTSKEQTVPIQQHLLLISNLLCSFYTIPAFFATHIDESEEKKAYTFSEIGSVYKTEFV